MITSSAWPGQVAGSDGQVPRPPGGLDAPKQLVMPQCIPLTDTDITFFMALI
jgi:hypothetical protein